MRISGWLHDAGQIKQGDNQMSNWRRLLPTFFVSALIALCLPAAALAQWGGGSGGYGGNGSNGRYGDNGGYGRGRDSDYDYDRRSLRDAVKRVKDRSGDFRHHLDRELDDSRINGSNREDQINSLADRFHDAADRLKDRYNDGRDLNRSSNEARNLLQLGADLERFMGRNRQRSSAESDWSQIVPDLRVIADAYGFNFADFGRNRNDDGNGRGRDSRFPRSGNNYPSRQGSGNWPFPWPF
jgi:hypothetical protein